MIERIDQVMCLAKHRESCLAMYDLEICTGSCRTVKRGADSKGNPAHHPVLSTRRTVLAGVAAERVAASVS